MGKDNIRKIKPVRIREERNKLPIKGKELVSELLPRVGMIAGTNSGKTTVLNHIIRNCIDERTSLFVICSTVHIDKVWQEIFRYCDRKKIPYEKLESMVDDKTGENALRVLLDELEVEQIEEEEEKVDKSQVKPPERMGMGTVIVKTEETERKEKEKRQKKKVYQDRVPKFMVVLDDIDSSTLRRNGTIYDCLKKCRKHGIALYLISQSVKDFEPRAKAQLTDLYIWKGFNVDYMKSVYEMMTGLDRQEVPFESFYKAFQMITKPKYSFMNVNLPTGLIRQNFEKPF